MNPKTPLGGSSQTNDSFLFKFSSASKHQFYSSTKSKSIKEVKLKKKS